MRSAIPFVLLAVVASTADAQQAAPRDPANPAAPVPKPVHESAFTGYRPWSEPATVRWRDANEEVRHLGGHTGHVKPSAKAPAAIGGKGSK